MTLRGQPSVFGGNGAPSAPLDFTGAVPVAPAPKVALAFRRVAGRDLFGQDGGAAEACRIHLGVESPQELDSASLRAHVEGLEQQYNDTDSELREQAKQEKAEAQLAADEFAALIGSIAEQLKPHASGRFLDISTPCGPALEGRVDAGLIALKEAVSVKRRAVAEVKRERLPGSIVVALRLAKAELEKREAAQRVEDNRMRESLRRLGVEV